MVKIPPVGTFTPQQTGTIPPRGFLNYKSGIKAQIPRFTYLRIAARSGTSWNNNIETGAGVIDPNYRKEIGIKLYNHSDVPHYIIAGDRVAQFVHESYIHDDLTLGVVNETDRGGFGSTGR